MTTIQIHPLSLLLGVGLTAIAGLTLSAQSSPLKAPLADQPFVVKHVVKVRGIPTPEEMMRVVEGQPFVVPEGRRFVATGVGGVSGTTYSVKVQFDGDFVYYHRLLDGSSLDALGTPAIPPGLSAPAGTLVSVDGEGGSDIGLLLGYLADA